VRKWLHASSNFTSPEKAKVQSFPLDEWSDKRGSHYGQGKQKNKQLYQQLHLYSTVDSSCIFHLRQGCTNSRDRVAMASEFLFHWRLISVGPQNGIFFMSRIRRWLLDFSENLCTPNLNLSLKEMVRKMFVLLLI